MDDDSEFLDEDYFLSPDRVFDETMIDLGGGMVVPLSELLED